MVKCDRFHQGDGVLGLMFALEELENLSASLQSNTDYQWFAFCVKDAAAIDLIFFFVSKLISCVLTC